MKRLADNFKGYDISPDMVRLSLVNMYLHGFVSPSIFEYDTLTSEERWDEYADVILANPPFMSPKGGIRPHNRFSVQSRRSEVLFVDYMAEHLDHMGRAGIIVPEGIIFQTQNAHKQLRKMLVEDCLVAVVSLPGGVFNPYSGVKTSILILDKSLARKADTIAFFKVENDGYDLGAQRRPIAEDDLPRVQSELNEYLRSLRSGESLDDFQSEIGLVVEKSKIAADGEYGLSGERYRQATRISSTFPFQSVGSICTINPRKSEVSGISPDTVVSFVPMADLNENSIRFTAKQEKNLGDVGASYTYFADDDVLLAKVTPCFENGKAGIARNLINGIGFGSSEYYVLRSFDNVLPEWVYFCVTHPFFRQAGIRSMTGTGGLQRVPRKFVEDFAVPLPPLEVQKEIVAEIEGYQKVIDGAQAVVENYRPQITVDPEWPLVKLGEVCEIIMGQSPPGHTYNVEGKGVPLINGPVEFGADPFSMTVINQYTTEPTKLCRAGDLLLCVRGATAGRMNIAGYSGCIGRGVAAIRSDNSQPWINHLVNSMRDEIYRLGSGSTFPNVKSKDLLNLLIPFPHIKTQQAIVAEIEAERALVDANRELITRFEKKIEDTIGRVWAK